ncbi:MAG: DUF6261 family protein [Dysgonamonadaceae bacterium]|nr:DUF6261 family protein [Dysgonamonadaceae bacterium]MDD4727916.1 DUF6261 family protein [Dysgonamonadaceae bacterium]
MIVKNINYGRLLKLELPQLAKNVLEIVEKHDLETLEIQQAYNDFSALEPEIESLIVAYGPHPLTERMKPLREKRILYATAFSFHVRGMVRGYINGTDEQIRVSKEAVNRYLYNIRANNEEVINERIDQFVKEYQMNLDLQEAISALGLSTHFDGLCDVHSQLMQLLATRNELMSQRPKGVTLLSRKIVNDGLRQLFNRIEVAQSYNKELDYTPLISELNEKLIRYDALIKLRKTIREGGNAPVDGGMEPTRMMMSHQSVEDGSIHLNGTSNVNGFDQNEDQKKAVAVSTKTTQLPFPKKEALN